MRNQVVRGSLTLGAADFSRKALLAGTVVLCARFLSHTTFGDYVFLLSFYQVFSVLGGSGLPNCLVRTAARTRDRGMILAIASVLARLAYIVPTALLMYFVMGVMGLSGKYFSTVGLLVLMMVVRGAAENVGFVFQGNEDQSSCAKIGVSQAAITLIFTLIVCATSKNLLLLIGAHVVGGFVSASYGFVLLRLKSLHQSVSMGPIIAEARALLRESHWLNAGAFVASAYNRVDVMLLRRFLTSDAVAVYGAPYRMLDITQIVPSSLMGTILPKLCRGESNQQSQHPRAAMRFLWVAALLIIIIGTLAAPSVMLLLFGPQYQSSTLLLQILLWATLPMFWNFALNAQLIAHSFDRAILYAASAALFVNVGLNLLLIPRIGSTGCAIVSVVTELVLLGINICFVSRIGATAAPEHLKRLIASTVLTASFCLCWLTGTRHPATLGALLVLAVFLLPIFRRDFSRPRSVATTGIRRVMHRST
jgi:O-antigen/teichoic acid export membrane protein